LKFNELDINSDHIASLMGFENGIAPEPFNQYINQTFDIAETASVICGSYYIFDNVYCNTIDNL
jgi:hypothetical protein